MFSVAEYLVFPQSFLDLQYAFLDTNFQVPNPSIGRRKKKQKTHHVQRSAQETFPKSTEAPVKTSQLNGLPASSAENELKPTLQSDTANKTKGFTTFSSTNNAEPFPRLEPTFSRPLPVWNRNLHYADRHIEGGSSWFVNVWSLQRVLPLDHRCGPPNTTGRQIVCHFCLVPGSQALEVN